MLQYRLILALFTRGSNKSLDDEITDSTEFYLQAKSSSQKEQL